MSIKMNDRNTKDSKRYLFIETLVVIGMLARWFRGEPAHELTFILLSSMLYGLLQNGKGNDKKWVKVLGRVSMGLTLFIMIMFMFFPELFSKG